QFIESEPVFNITLATANFTASIFDVVLITTEAITQKSSDDFILMNTAVPSEQVEDLEFNREEFGNYNIVEEDMMPGDFMANHNREVRKMNRLLFSISSNPVRVKLKEPYFQVILRAETINLQFMDA